MPTLSKPLVYSAYVTQGSIANIIDALFASLEFQPNTFLWFKDRSSKPYFSITRNIAFSSSI